MDLNSRLFDRIRVKPRGGARAAQAAQPAPRLCDHPGCTCEGAFRAPKGRAHEGQFFHFCLEHVREYNQSYNYFAGMKDEAVAAYQKDAVTGHRPTWRMGTGTGGAAGAGFHPSDPFDVLGGGGFDPRRRARPPEESGPSVSHAARKAMETLGVDPGTPGPEIKSLYKTLVKRLHPDANGGDRSNEDRLREIINAYNHLRSAGMV